MIDMLDEITRTRVDDIIFTLKINIRFDLIKKNIKKISFMFWSIRHSVCIHKIIQG